MVLSDRLKGFSQAARWVADAHSGKNGISTLAALIRRPSAMNRRSTEVTGYVNFPVNDPSWEFTGEGGMFVRLVVEDVENTFMQCCGGHSNVVIYDESFVGTDKEERYHFPRLNRQFKSDDPYKYTSIPYLAILTIGSTGWSGWNEEHGYYWKCAEEDLTEKGKELLEALKALYPGCRIDLQTWLDT